MTITLPARIDGSHFLPFVSQIGTGSNASSITLDFSGLRRVTPAGLTTLVATVISWRREHRKVEFTGLYQCPILGYLQRMDVLEACGIETAENFARHESQGRFMPVRLVDVDVTQLGRDIAGCLAPGGEDFDHPMAGLYDFANYVITEAANNIRQHSRGLGYAAAQVRRSEGMVRIAVADNGIGILRSLQRVEFAGSGAMTHPQAILKALEPRVSSKAGEPNEGVGLTLVKNLARLAEGYLAILSGDGVILVHPQGELIAERLPADGFYRGTILTGSFPQNKAKDFATLLHRAKDEAGLLRRGTLDARFQS